MFSPINMTIAYYSETLITSIDHDTSTRSASSAEFPNCQALEGVAAAWMMTAKASDTLRVSWYVASVRQTKLGFRCVLK